MLVGVANDVPPLASVTLLIEAPTTRLAADEVWVVVDPDEKVPDCNRRTTPCRTPISGDEE